MYLNSTFKGYIFVLKHFDQTQELQTMAKKCSQFYTIRTYDFYVTKTLFTWSGGPRSSEVSFFCFVSPRAWKQKKLTPLDRGPPLHVNRVLDSDEILL